jgi:hypothetical protein
VHDWREATFHHPTPHPDLMVFPFAAGVGHLDMLDCSKTPHILDLRSDGEDGASGALCSRGGGAGTALASRGGGGGTARSVSSC